MKNSIYSIKGSNKRNDILKLLAIITMLIDHLGYIFFPDIIFLRVIGRIAFPIFAYHISIGYINTSNLRNYAIRLFLFGLISQLPYNMLFKNGLNIFFTLFLGLIFIYSVDKKKYIVLALVILSPIIFDIEYGYYGLFIILSFYYFRENHNNTILSITFINIIYFINYNFSIQIFSLLALWLIHRDWKIKIKLNKYLYYSFYPLHIGILYIISTLVNIR
jgi:hypothetical protein